MDERSLRKDLDITLSVWRFQIDSYWSRNSYFVTFHSAIMAAVWQISKNAGMSAPRKLAAECFCYAGIFLAVLWLVNNLRVHQYILYWWGRAAAIEKLMDNPEETRLVLGYEQHRLPKFLPGEYHLWMNSIPVLFFILWVGIRMLCF